MIQTRRLLSGIIMLSKADSTHLTPGAIGFRSGVAHVDIVTEFTTEIVHEVVEEGEDSIFVLELVEVSLT